MTPTDGRIAFPEALAKAEAKMIAARRALANIDDASGPNTGLALSGGGIRSATLSLGILQALAAGDWIRRLDYLSTVSGGGYAGAFLGGLFQPRDANGEATPAPSPVDVAARLGPHAFPGKWLRENGRYLAPAGASDGWIALAVVLRNLVAVHVVLGSLALTAFLGAAALRAAIGAAGGALFGAFGHGEKWSQMTGWWVTPHVWLSPWLALPALLIAFVCLPPAIAYWLIGANLREDGGGRVSRLRPHYTCVALALVGFALFVVHLAIHFRRGLWEALTPPASLAPATLGVISLLSVAVWKRLKGTGEEARNLVTVWLRTGLVLTTAALAFAIIDTLAQTIYATTTAAHGAGHLVKRLGGVVAAIGTLAGVVQKAKGFLSGNKKTHVPLPYKLLALLAAALVVGTLLISVDAIGLALAHGWTVPLETAKVTHYHLAEVIVQDGGPVLTAKTASAETGFVPLPAAFSAWWLAISLGVGVGLVLIFGRSFAFLNRSSLSSLYAARITRTYLGASNGMRRNEVNRNVTRTIPGDEIDFAAYAPHLRGGPLHIVNVTLNETVPAQSQVEQRDRHGMNMAVGPAGVSVGVRHHALWDRAMTHPPAKLEGRLCPVDEAPGASGFRIFSRQPPGAASGGGIGAAAETAPAVSFAPEALNLGQWIAVSGAAVSTGLGSRTSIGLSLLIGLVNARLGRWWTSGVDPALQRDRTDYESILRSAGRAIARLLPVHAHLIDELLARFHGPASESWYLTDGGHFENTGVYELIRRRVEVIFVCDNGADGEQSFTDVAELMRKARLDFDTAIEFVAAETLATWGGADHAMRSVAAKLGTLEDLGFRGDAADDDGGAKPAVVRRYATVAKLCYPGGAAPGLLVVVKPRCTGDETLDVREYARNHAGFPQQSTGDQFFDDQQWESYRKLGEIIGTTLFVGTDVGEPAQPWPLWLQRHLW